MGTAGKWNSRRARCFNAPHEEHIMRYVVPQESLDRAYAFVDKAGAERALKALVGC